MHRDSIRCFILYGKVSVVVIMTVMVVVGTVMVVMRVVVLQTVVVVRTSAINDGTSAGGSMRNCGRSNNST